jgi:hypothetical protein
VRTALAGLDDDTRRLDADRRAIDRQRDRLLAQRRTLTATIAQRLVGEQAAGPTGTESTGGTGPPGQPVTSKQPRVPTQPSRPAMTGPALEPITPTRPFIVTRPTTAESPTHAQLPRQPRGPAVEPPAAAHQAVRVSGPRSPTHLVETSPQSAQNTQLTLGAILLGIAAIVIAGVYYTTASGGRAAVLGVATTIFLGLPLLLTGKLFATAETIASIGLLLVLLDGYTAYTADLAGVRALNPPLYAAILFALVTGVAGAYRFATHLRAPQFAALLTVQPLLPLLAVNFHFGREGFAAVFAVVAAFNLGAVGIFGLELRILAAGRLRPRARSALDQPTGLGWPRMLRELAWLMFGLTLATSVVLATEGLVRAGTARGAVPAALDLVLAAAVGMAAGQLQSDRRVRVIAGGAATLAVIAAISRVDYLALPDDTLIITAALAAVMAIATNALPARVSQGPQLGALVAAAIAGVVVLAETVRTTVAVLVAATSPHVWAGDLIGYAQQTHVTAWQVPFSAVLLALFGVLVAPPAWRTDAAVLGGAVVLLAAPGTGSFPWWAASLLAVAASTAATTTSLYASRGRDALIRSGTAGLLGLYAVATSLARPGLTATVSTALALTAGATAAIAVGWPDRFGAYRERVADAAFGAAAFTLPIAVATFAWLAGLPAGVVLPITMVTTALGVMGAAVSQVAARLPHTASAGAALAAAVATLLFGLLVPGREPVDVGVGVLIVTAALATTGSRIFEVGGGGIAEAVRTLPAAVSAAEDAFAGRPDRPDPAPRRRSIVDTSTLGAALSTAALIVALARLAAVVVPGIGLVTTEAMVLVTASAVLLLPERWRRGPRLGGVAIGGTVALVLAGIAVTEAVHAAMASGPFWSADLVTWTQRVAGWTPYGSQVPVGLLLAAGAFWALLPPPVGEDLGFVTLCVAALSLPATLGLHWWAPVLLAAGLGVVTGLGAALVPPGRPGALPATRRLVLAFLLGGYAVIVASARPASTGVVLGTFVAAGAAVALVGHLRRVAAIVPGTALAAGLAASSGAAATAAAAIGTSAPGVLAAALLLAALGIPVVLVVRAASFGGMPGIGVGIPSVITALAAAVALPAFRDAQTWAAAAALVAVTAVAADIPRESRRPTTPTPLEDLATSDDGDQRPRVPANRGAWVAVVTTVVPAAAIAAVASAPAWLTALAGPYRTLSDVWRGYGHAPVPSAAGGAVITLLLLAGVGAIGAASLGGRRFVLALVLPPLAAMAVVAPAAMATPAGTTSWVALGVAVVAGLGAALSPPALPAATHLLRGTAGIVCVVTGGAGLAGSLATRAGTLTALAVLAAAGATAAAVGRDPNARKVAWFVTAAAAFAFPVTALATADGQLRTGAFFVLAVCGALSGASWQLARFPKRRPEAAVVELTVAIGATFALLLSLSSPRHAAAVLTIWGLLLGVAALRRDRTPRLRQWLVRAALVAELFASWVLLYSVQVALPEAYTLPFAAIALLAGALELRNNNQLSSWLAYGPALVGGFAPSVALVLIGHDAVARWVTLFAVAVLTVIVGSSRGLRAPVMTGGVVVVIVAVAEMIRFLVRGQIAGALLVALAGGILVGFGARSEQRRRARREIG